MFVLLKRRLTKLMVSILTVSFVAMNFIGHNARALSKDVDSNLVRNETEEVSMGGSQDNYYKNGGPIDTAVANEFKIIEMLKNEGKISKEATFEEEQEAYTEYMQNVAKIIIKR